MDINPERKRDWGRRLEVFWEGDGVFYCGTVTGYSANTGKHTVMYDDGDVERVKLDQVRACLPARSLRTRTALLPSNLCDTGTLPATLYVAHAQTHVTPSAA